MVLPISKSPNLLNVQAYQSTSPNSPLEVPELVEKIKKHIEDIEDPKEKLAYWQAYTIPTKEDGEPFDSVAVQLALVREPKPLKEEKKKVNAQLEAKKIEKNERQNELATLQTEEDRERCEQAIANIEKSQRDLTEKLEKIEIERRTREQTIFENNPKLRTSILTLPSKLSTENAKVFANRYAQVAPYLKTLTEYGQALRGFRKFIVAGAYTHDSQLNQVRRMQREILEHWFSTASSGITGFDEELTSVRGIFFKDPQGPGQAGKGSLINKNLGTALRSLVEAPKKEVGTILNSLSEKLRPPQDSETGYLNELFYNVFTEYLPHISEATTISILNKLSSVHWDDFSYSQKSIIFKQLTLYTSSKASKLNIQLISGQSFRNIIFTLTKHPELKHGVILGVLKDILDYIEYKKDIKFLNDFKNYLDIISERRLKAKLNNILKLFTAIHELNLNININKFRQKSISPSNQTKIINLSIEYIEKLNDRAISPILIGISNIWELFWKEGRNILINLIAEYLPRASRKEEIFKNIIKNLNKLTKKEQHLIINSLAPYLNSSHAEEEVPVPVLLLLTQNWGSLLEEDQLNVLTWLQSYLAQNNSLELLKVIRENSESLSKKAQNKASKLLKQYSSEKILNQPMKKLMLV